MREIDVRDAVRSGPLRKYFVDNKSRVIDELAVCLGEARIDIAVVNGKLSGYELKSKNDTLIRLPKQAEAYSRVFDEITLVVDSSHSEASLKIIPEAWGVLEVRQDKVGKILLSKLRSAEANGAQAPLALAQLLWKEELLDILSRSGLRAPSSKSRGWLWAQLAAEMPLQKLKKEVRLALKKRADWRS